jgi:hypothetical protein
MFTIISIHWPGHSHSSTKVALVERDRGFSKCEFTFEKDSFHGRRATFPFFHIPEIYYFYIVPGHSIYSIACICRNIYFYAYCTTISIVVRTLKSSFVR